MPENKALNAIVGYQEAWQSKQLLEKSGSDFTERRGEIEKTLSQLHPKRLALVVSEVLDETDSTKTLRLVRPDGGTLPPFQAGQYINLFTKIDGVETARPYAISSSPLERRYYDLTVKRAAGGFVSHYLLDRVSKGDKFLSTGPMGTFHHNPLFHGDDLVFLAGGSGSAPARSMILDVIGRELPFRFHLIYVNSFEHDVIFAEEFRKLARSHPEKFRLTEIVTRPTPAYQGLSGRLSSERLGDLIGSAEGKMFYICGPTPFNESCVEQLSALGVKRRRMRVEANGAPQQPSSQKGWPEGVSENDAVTVTVQGKGSFKARVGEPLLNSLERNGYSTENACRSGECSLCRVKVVSGSVFNPQEAHLRQSDRDFGWIYSCVAFPTEDIEILL